MEIMKMWLSKILYTILHSPFIIRSSSFVIRHSPFIIRSSSFVIRHSPFVNRNSSFVIRKYSPSHLITTGVLFCSLALFIFPSPAHADHTCNDFIIATTPAGNFSVHNDGTVTDDTTGLMWMRCSLGQEWDGKTCSGTAAVLSWGDGLKEAANYEFAGYGDWRLPNKNELESIVEGRCFSPAINTEIFPATPTTYFWSSSPYAAASEGAWSIDFGYGTVNASVKVGLIHIRLVRDDANVE